MGRALMQETVAVSRRRLSLATGFQVGARILGALMGVFVAASLARSLSRPSFGELSLALTILSLASSLGDFGMGQIAIREMARRPAQRAHIAGALFVAQLAMAVVFGAIGSVLLLLLMHGHEPKLMAIFIMATLPLGALNVFTIAAHARLRPELAAAPALVQSAIWLAVVLALGASHASLALYGAGFAGVALVQAAFTFGLGARITTVRFAGTREGILGLLRLAWPIGLAGVFVTAYYKIDGVILFHYKGATASAYYGAAYRVIDVLQILPMTVSGVVFPLLAGAQREAPDPARIQRLFGFAAAMLLSVALPVAACGAIIAPSLVHLIYGAHYHPSAYLLAVLLPAFVPICLGYLLTGQLILHGLLAPYVWITSLGAVLNVLVNALLIPRYGAAAAAWSTTGTELLVMICIAAVVARRTGLRLPAGRAARCAGAVALTAAVLWPLRTAPLPLSMGAAVIVYLPCLLLSRAITLAEVRGLLSRKAAADA